MAFNDIREWAGILESQENEVRSWNEACDKANREAAEAAAELDEHVDQISFEDLGITPCEKFETLYDQRDFDEPVDFEAYGVTKQEPAKPADADMKEILKRIAIALEKPAGTANLVAQDTVVVNETDETDETDESMFEAMMDEAEDKMAEDKIDDKLKNAPEAVKDAVKDAYVAAKDYPFNDDGAVDAFLNMSLPDQINVIKQMLEGDGLSKDAKLLLQQDLVELERWLNSRIEHNRLLRKAMQMQKASFERELTHEELAEFRKIVTGLDDLEKAILLTNPEKKGYGKVYKVFLNPEYLKINNGGNRQSASSADQDDEEIVDKELAAIDAELSRNGHKFQADKQEYVAEPNEPGYYDTQFDPNHVTPSERLKQAKFMLAKLEKEGWVKDYYENVIKPEKAAETADMYDKESGGVDFADEDVVRLTKLLDKLPATEKEKLRQDFLSRCEAPNERDMVNSIFDGKAARPNLKDVNSWYGVGYDQKGGTGAGTEDADKHTNLRLIIMCQYLNIMADETQMMSANLRSENTRQREIRKALRGPMMAGILDELDDNVKKGLLKAYGVDGRIPDPNSGAREKRLFWKLVAYTMGAIAQSATPEERRAMGDMYADFKRNSQVRKLKTFLTYDENKEYQALMAKQRDFAQDVTDDDRLRILDLDLRRHGFSADQAPDIARQILSSPDPEEQAKKRGVSLAVATTFLKGQVSTRGKLRADAVDQNTNTQEA